jgi:hypothetical protein
MKLFKELFSEIFTILAWVTLLTYIFVCTFYGIKTDSIRDAWNVVILIAGFVWGSKHQKSNSSNSVTIPNSSVEIKGTIDTSKQNPDETT